MDKSVSVTENTLPAWTKFVPLLVSLLLFHLAFVFQISSFNPILHMQSTVGLILALWWGWRAVAGFALATLIPLAIWSVSRGTLVFHPAFILPELIEILLAWGLVKDRFKGELWNTAPATLSKYAIYAVAIPALIQAPISHLIFYFLGYEDKSQAFALGAREFLGDALGGITIGLPAFILLTPWLQKRGWSLFKMQELRKGWMMEFSLKSKILFALGLITVLMMSMLFPLRQTWYVLAIIMLLYSVLGGLQATLTLNAGVTLLYIAAPAFRGETYVPDIESIQGTATLLALTFSSLLAGSAVTSLTDKVRALRQAEVELKNARDQAQEASRAKSEFLARMSHEIRTPLNSVLGMLELLKETHLTKEQERYISLFSHAGENLKALINDLLDFSKIEAKAVAVENVSFNVHATLRSVFELLQIKAEEKGLTFELEIDPQVPLYQWGDPTRFRQILFNLVGNALKFTDEGEVKVHMHLKKNDPRWLLIEIKDTGIGIPREKQSRIFNPFFQGDTSTTRKYGGTGLGLVISKNLIEIMGGFLELKSLKGRGTTFIVSLPHRPDLNPPVEKKASLPPLLSWPPNKRFRLLLVDDSEDNRILLIHYLKDQPFDCDEAANGQEAYEKAKANHYDLIFMDIQMPVMSGYKSTELIRNDEKINNKPPTQIVALTATAVIEDLQKTLQSGCDGYLVKPVKKTEILEVLKKHLLISETEETNIPLSPHGSELHDKDTF